MDVVVTLDCEDDADNTWTLTTNGREAEIILVALQTTLEVLDHRTGTRLGRTATGLGLHIDSLRELRDNILSAPRATTEEIDIDAWLYHIRQMAEREEKTTCHSH